MSRLTRGGEEVGGVGAEEGVEAGHSLGAGRHDCLLLLGRGLVAGILEHHRLLVEGDVQLDNKNNKLVSGRWHIWRE